MNSQLIIEFLTEKIDANEKIIISFIFGSLAKGSQNPNDCDLFVVTNQTPFNEKWNCFLLEMGKLETDFLLVFELKLNIIINTENEFLESSEFKERIIKRPIIKIK